MSHFLATAAEIVGGVALLATGVGAAASIGLFGTVAAGSGLAGTLATIATVAKVAGFAAAALAATSALTAHRLTAASPDLWSADPDAGMDIVLGDAYNGGNILYRFAYGDKNKYETIITHWSIGPVHSIDQLYVDQIARGVTGQTVEIDDRGMMHEARQLGLCPEPTELNVGPINPWGWTSQHKLSGKAATICTFEYDSSGSSTFESIPACGWRGKGVLCYDARLDSSYPGGNGPQRVNDQSTWAFSRNPFVLGVTWCLGWRQNGKLVAGVGLPVTGLLLDQFVEASNIADANQWACGGVKSTTDDKWDVLTDILQAGGGEPMRLGALLGCVVKAPRVSLATITRDDLAQGDISITATTARRDRINTVSPRYWAELTSTVSTEVNNNLELNTSTTWAQQTGAPIVVDAYVTADGRQRRKQVDYALVQCFAGQQPTQVAQLARYDIEDAREFGPINLPLKIRWMGYKPGDVVTVDLPEAGLIGQDIMLQSRSLEPSTGVVTITARSETAGKHAFALGQTTTPPPAPSLPANAWSLSVPGLAAVVSAATQNAILYSWIVEVTAGVAVIAASADGTVTIDANTRRYSDGHADVAVDGATLTSGLAAGETRSIAYDDPGRGGGAVTYQLFADDNDAHASAANPGRHFVGYVTIPASGTSTGGGGGVIGGRGECAADTAITVLANADGTGPGEKVALSTLKAGDMLWTQREVTFAWGAYPVEDLAFVTREVWKADGYPRATPDHRFRVGDRWVAMATIGTSDGNATVCRVTVKEARTLITDGVLSHNIKSDQPTINDA